jgi:hypothetical protein
MQGERGADAPERREESPSGGHACLLTEAAPHGVLPCGKRRLMNSWTELI